MLVGKTSTGYWIAEELRRKGIPCWYRTERIDEWKLNGMPLLDLARLDPR